MVVCSAPGKIQWLGGYSVMERPNVSFNTGVDRRVYASAKESSMITLKSRQFNAEAQGVFDGESLVLNGDVDKLSFVKAAAEAALRYLAFKNIVLKNFELETFSDAAFGIGVKSGLGSSAAVTVAVAASLFEMHGLPAEKHGNELFKICQWAHARAQHKVGSGFDIAAACFGASSYVRHSPELLEKPFPQSVDEPWDYELAAIPLPPAFKVAVASLHKSASTSEFVKKFVAWKEAKPHEYWEIMTQYNACNLFAITALKKMVSEYSEKNLAEFKKFFNYSQFMKKQIGIKSGADIESDDYTKLREESAENGAFVSCLPGAGGGDSIAAFCLSAEDKKRLESFWASKGLTVLNLNVSSEGVRVESYSDLPLGDEFRHSD